MGYPCNPLIAIEKTAHCATRSCNMDNIQMMFSDVYAPPFARGQDSQLPGVSELLSEADDLLGAKDSFSSESPRESGGSKGAAKKSKDEGSPKTEAAESKKDVTKAKKETSETAGEAPDSRREPGQKADLTIIHLNDFHGYIEEHEPEGPDQAVGGLARIAGKVKELKSQNPDGTILLDGGDFFDAGFYSKYSGGEIVSKPYHQMGFDAIALGNHDLTWGSKAYEKLTESVGSPILAANVEDTSQDGVISKLIQPYGVIEKKGVRIGILGFTTRLTQVGCPEKGIMNIKDATPDIEKSIKDFKSNQDVDMVVVLSHLGYDRDVEIAKNVDGINVIVGAHSHTQLEKGEKVNDTVIVQTAGEGNYLGALNLTFDPKGKSVTSYDARVIPVTADIEPDREVEAIMAPYMEKYKPVKDEVQGSTNQDLVMYDDNVQATNLTNFYIDALRMDSDFSLASMFSIRKGLKKGNITTGDLFTMYPFDNKLCKVKATGAQVLKFLESGLKDGYKGNYLIFSGLEFNYDPSRPEGSRIVSLTTGGKTYSAKEFRSKSFNVAMDDYTQGKNYFKGSKITKVYGKIFDILKDYIHSNSPLDNISSELRYHKVGETAG